MYTICSYCHQIDKTPSQPIWLCNCGKPREIHYNWEGQKRPIDIDENKQSLWRYHAVLPDIDEKVTLDEGYTPLLQIENKHSNTSHLLLFLLTYVQELFFAIFPFHMIISPLFVLGFFLKKFLYLSITAYVMSSSELTDDIRQKSFL